MTGKPAYTIHKKIYRQISSKDGFGGFSLNKNFSKDTVFIVDEASMISNELQGSSVFGSGMLLNDLINFVFEAPNCRLMLIGDTAQLPPVGLELSPALDISTFDNQTFDLFSVELTDVLRQSEKSGILYNATYLRKLLNKNQPISEYPKLAISKFTDIKSISGAEFQEELSKCYDLFGLENTLVICRTNKRTNLYNKGIRGSILYREDELSSGDYLLIMKNNYHWLKENETINFIANGDIVRVLRVHKHYDLYGYRFADITCQMIDYKEMEIDVRIILDSIFSDGPGFSQSEQENFLKKVLDDYADEPSLKKKYELARENDFYNALQIKFSYSITCHKSQGGQWKAVFIDLGYFTEEYLSREFIRWLYTAFTRASEKLYLVNFPKEFF
jgi:exodeoxyribonuclease-5